MNFYFAKIHRMVMIILICLLLSAVCGSIVYGQETSEPEIAGPDTSVTDASSPDTSNPNASGILDSGSDDGFLADPTTKNSAAKSALELNGFIKPFVFTPTESSSAFADSLGGAVGLQATAHLGNNWGGLMDLRVKKYALAGFSDLSTDIRELYLDLNVGNLDIRAGKQIIVWGTADGINPTDNLCPKDLRFFSADDNDRRFGVNALQAKYYFRNYYLSGIWIADFAASQFPTNNLPSNIVMNSVQDPEDKFENTECAFKLGTNRGSVDYSLSYYSGWNRLPEMGLDRVVPAPPGPPAIYLTPRFHRIQVGGADFSTTVGKYGLRGEAAYCFTEGGANYNPEIMQPYLLVILGADRTFLANFNINLQYIHRTVSDFHDPYQITDPIQRQIAVRNAISQRQLAADQNSVSLRLNNKWLQDTLEAELLMVYDFYEQDTMLQPKITYAFTDSFKATLGAVIFDGAADTYYGTLKKSNMIYCELKFSF